MNGQDKVKDVTPEEQANLDAQLDKIYSVEMKQRQWIVIYNVLVGQSYRLGDAKIINEICDRLQPVVVVASNIPPKKEEKKQDEEGVILN